MLLAGKSGNVPNFKVLRIYPRFTLLAWLVQEDRARTIKRGTTESRNARIQNDERDPWEKMFIENTFRTVYVDDAPCNTCKSKPSKRLQRHFYYLRPTSAYHICMHECTYVCMHVCTYTRMYLCMYVYTYIFIWIYIYTHVPVHIHMYVCTYVCMYVHMYIHMHTYICLYIYIYIYTYVYYPTLALNICSRVCVCTCVFEFVCVCLYVSTPFM